MIPVVTYLKFSRADSRNRERLDSSRNTLSSAGLNAIRKARVNAIANNSLAA
jgi:hypothetical protein